MRSHLHRNAAQQLKTLQLASPCFMLYERSLTLHCSFAIAVILTFQYPRSTDTMQIFKRIWPQLFPAKPTIAADNLHPHAGRVVIITGDTSTLGLGLGLAHILHRAG